MLTSEHRLSFEFFPPKTEAGFAKLGEARKALAVFSPDFFSVTYGAGGGAGNHQPGAVGTANTGNGGQGSGQAYAGSAGGSGVVILSVPDADYSGTTTGSPTVTTGVSGKTIIKFTGDGSYTA